MPPPSPTRAGAGLYIQSLNVGADPPYDVSVITNGIISGTQHGIAAYNANFGGTGDLSITVTGDVAGVDVDEAEGDDVIANDGIHALNFNQDLTITTGAESLVTGEHNAIDARNLGTGDLTINADGVLVGYEYDGVFARNHGRDLNITLGAESEVVGYGNGVQALNLGQGNLDITADGFVLGLGADGIRALNVIGTYTDPTTGNVYGAAGVDLTVTTGAQSAILGYDNGIDARNTGSGNLSVTADGYVYGYSYDGLYATNTGGSLTITNGCAKRGAGRRPRHRRQELRHRRSHHRRQWLGRGLFQRGWRRRHPCLPGLQRRRRRSPDHHHRAGQHRQGL